MEFAYSAKEYTDKPVMLVSACEKDHCAELRVFPGKSRLKWCVKVTSVHRFEKGYRAVEGVKLPCTTDHFPATVVCAFERKKEMMVAVFSAPVHPLSLHRAAQKKTQSLSALLDVCRIQQKKGKLEYIIPPVATFSYDQSEDVVGKVLELMGFGNGWVSFELYEIVVNRCGWKEAYLAYRREDGGLERLPSKAIVSPHGRPVAVVGNTYFLLPHEWLLRQVKPLAEEHGLKVEVLRKDNLMEAILWQGERAGYYLVNSIDGSSALYLCAFVGENVRLCFPRTYGTWKHTKQLTGVRKILGDTLKKYSEDLPRVKERLNYLKRVPVKVINGVAYLESSPVKVDVHVPEVYDGKSAYELYMYLAGCSPRSPLQQIQFFKQVNRFFGL